MRRFVKLDSENNIIDLFFEHKIEKFDGLEIEIDEGDELKIDGQSISDLEGFPIFKYENNEIVSATNIPSSLFLNYKDKQKNYLKTIIKEFIFDIFMGEYTSKTRDDWFDEISTKMINVRNNFVQASTVGSVNTIVTNVENYISNAS